MMMVRNTQKSFAILLLLICAAINGFAQNEVRRTLSLNDNWRSAASDSIQIQMDGFERTAFSDKSWKPVDVPHNWDQYEGYRRMKHGNRHGTAWYRKTFTVPATIPGRRYFLFFEGVGSYATVWLNGKKAGYHAGGRTTFTLDVTDVILLHQPNLLAVQADHPPFIQDLPWVCGGCSEEGGFSEGSQPMGIFRPVSLVITDPVRIEPFGVHVWNDTSVSGSSAALFLETEIKNYSNTARKITVLNSFHDGAGKEVAVIQTVQEIVPGKTQKFRQDLPRITNPQLWFPGKPYLYTLVSQIIEKGKVVDEVRTPYGIRKIKWDIFRKDSTSRFYVNGQPVFINGTAEYEHLMGKSGAFSDAEIRARVSQVRAAGFNAFRDAHQPHNLRYGQYWDSLGILWWPQMAAHIWYNTPAFRDNFKQLLRDWVKERRNSPSIILWGLQNESKLPEDFAWECSAIIRELDPTASSQRLITTCNGGRGTDWDVPQNWTGTYGGDPLTYASDIKRQQLIGEYGAWRSIDLHTEGPFVQNGTLSEDRMTGLMETKIRLAESVRDKTCGQFHWLLYSHENPGRAQSGEGYRELDRVGPVNYKGLFTPWGEPTDAFYMFRANYAPKETEPMVYIVSHTWPDRWTKPGVKDSIVVYSNCDEVELYGTGRKSFGRKKSSGIGTHFQWDSVNVQYNSLTAIGRVKGEIVASDGILLHHLPDPPESYYSKIILPPAKGLSYLYRVNCGGPDYTDKNGNLWQADRKETSDTTWGSLSWAADFPGMPPFFASQRTVATKSDLDWPLFQSFRYGLDKLRYDFPVKDGDYLVDLYFTEPWYRADMNCLGWRVFDVAINGKTILKNLDIWKETSFQRILKKSIPVHITGGHLTISFPRAAAGEAIISAIAIATKDKSAQPAPPSPLIITNLQANNISEEKQWSVQSWMNTGDLQYSNDAGTTFSALPPALYGAVWIRAPKEGGQASFTLREDADVFAAIPAQAAKAEWLKDYADTKSVIENDDSAMHRFEVFTRRFPKGTKVDVGDKDATPFILAANPVSTIDPAFDLKPTISNQAPKAVLKGTGLVRDSILGKACATFNRASGDTLIWEIAVGVGSQYALRFKYVNNTGKRLTTGFRLLAADGSLMNEGELIFNPSGTGKWSILNTTTGTSINAGTYKIMLTARDAAGLSLSGLEVQ